MTTRQKLILEAFSLGCDPHTYTAAHFNGVDYNSVTKEQRMFEKSLNYAYLCSAPVHDFHQQHPTVH